MKTLCFPTPDQPARAKLSRPLRRRSNGFTLMEVLIVIVIIAMLASLITGVVWRARIRANIAHVSTEIKTGLEMACENYKTKFGEYPPDFACDVATTAGQQVVLRHLAKAFPRYVPGVSTTGNPGDDNTWAGFCADVLAGWNLDISTYPLLLTPASATLFWLGGQPDWLVDTGTFDTNTKVHLGDTTTAIAMARPVRGFLGFSANPLNPFESNVTATSRIQPFYEFNPNCVRFTSYDPSLNRAQAPPPPGLKVWPTMAFDAANAHNSPVVYFRANNGTYYTEDSTPGATAIKLCTLGVPDSGAVLNVYVFPAIDTRESPRDASNHFTDLTWVNPRSIQIFSSGLDTTFGTLDSTVLTAVSGRTFGGANPNNVLQFPKGTNYVTSPALAPPNPPNPPNPGYTFDDITNFSGGTLEDAIP